MTAHMDWDHPPDIAEVRRWQLIVSGRRVIEQLGLDGFTVEDVTREARVAKGTFYTYFPSRIEFLDALRAALGADVLEAVRTAARGPWDGIFVRMMSTVAGWLRANPELAPLFGPAYLSRPDRPTRAPLLALVEGIVRDGIEIGVFRPLEADGDPAAAAAVVYDVLSAGINRVSPVTLQDRPLDVTGEFIERALRFDREVARGREWPATEA